jgi:hypothetical protein
MGERLPATVTFIETVLRQRAGLGITFSDATMVLVATVKLPRNLISAAMICSASIMNCGILSNVCVSVRSRYVWMSSTKDEYVITAATVMW